MTTITQDYVCVKSKLNNHDKPETKGKKRKISSDIYRNKKSSKMNSKHKWNIPECDPSKQVHEYDGHTMSIETQRKKTPVSLLNEWAMRISGSTRSTIIVSYVLISITGQIHKPIFTYMCQVQDKTAKGKGLSKKEAKQNAAAQMWEQLFEIDSIANSDKVITSTTISNNFEVNKNNYTNNLTSIEGFQKIGQADSDINDKKLQHSKYAEVEIAHCDMNPIGALQELTTTYKWVPPLFNFQKSVTFNKNREQHRKYRVVSYKVTCQVFPLQTIGIAITKKKAKRIAAHKMFYQIYDIGIDKFNELKSSEFDKIMLSNKDFEKDKFITAQLEIKESPPKWTSAHIFKLYIATINSKLDFVVPSYSLFESNNNLNLQKEQSEIKKTQHQMKLEQFILQYNPNLSSVNQLHSLCQKLGFQAIYTQLNNLELQQQNIKNNTGQEYFIMLQVSTLPVIVTIGRAMTIDMASEVAATDILHTLKAMWCFSSPFISKLNNNQQIANDDFNSFL